MKICIPTMTDQGMTSEICGHFGSAPWFTLYHQESQQVSVIANPKAEHEHGQCRPMDALANQGITAVICKGMGKGAIGQMERGGIKVFVTTGATVREAIDELMDGRLRKLDPEKACNGHASY